MNRKRLIRILGTIILVEFAAMLPPLGISMYTRDQSGVRGFLLTLLIMLILSGIMLLYSRNAGRKMSTWEDVICTGLCWVALSVLGALPLFLSGQVPDFVDSLFEITSGFTTTGASVISDIEKLGKGVIFWRSFSHWLGGMGVLAFFLAILPAKGNDNGYAMNLLRSESPGPMVSKIVPRLKESTEILYMIYIGLTVLDIIFLLIAKMPVFDAFCIAFGTAGTGGFAVLNSGFATYTVLAQNVTTVFMILFGINFSLFYLLLIRRFRNVFRDEEIRLYFGIIFVSIIVITINMIGKTQDTATLGETVKNVAFTVGSIITTTGFSTADFDGWNSLSKAILFLLMIVGATAGSTGGGLKVSRLLVLYKAHKRTTHNRLYPDEVKVIKLNGEMLSERIIVSVESYLVIYFIIIAISFILVSADPVNYSFETNLSAVIATFNNIGPGFGKVGPTANFSGYSMFSKIVMTVDMLLGRLEIYPILALFAFNSLRRKY